MLWWPNRTPVDCFVLIDAGYLVTDQLGPAGDIFRTFGAFFVINSDKIIARLERVSAGTEQISQSQMVASKLLLDKSLPNIASVAPVKTANDSPFDELSTPELHAFLMMLTSEPIPVESDTYGMIEAELAAGGVERIVLDKKNNLTRNNEYSSVNQIDGFGNPIDDDDDQLL